MGDLNTLQNRLGITFNNPKLLQQAFTHRSYLNEARESLQSNERLEFLGDAILSFIVSSYLFQVRKNDAEGDLTNLRSYIVKTKSLAEAAQSLNLGEYLRMSKGEDVSGGRTNPQLLANTFEALLGAVFLDSGLEETKKVVFDILLVFFQKEIEMGPPKDAKSQLQEVVQTLTKKSPLYRILNTHGPDHAKTFTVGVFMKGEMIGEGEGPSKQEAEEKAARLALKNVPVLKSFGQSK